MAESGAPALHEFRDLGIAMETVGEVEEDAAWYYYARKVFAAAQAEADLAETGETLAWLDEDTVFLQEPAEFNLPEGVSLGYRPVMHRNIGLRVEDRVDSFWQRVFDDLSVSPATLFPMVTPSDGETIRPYINAGCLIVSPDRGLLRKWAEYWPILYRDPDLRRMCKADIRKRIFLHQVALTCAFLNHLRPDERLELSFRINYPIFFKEMFGGAREFDDLTDVTTFRHESYFRDPAPDWEDRLKGPAGRIDWIRTHIARKPVER